MSEFSERNSSSKTKEQLSTLQDLLKELNHSESGGLIRDLLNGAAISPTQNSCDTRPQSTLTGNLKDSCGLEIDSIYKKVNESTVKLFNKDFEAIGSGFYACTDDGSTCGIITNHHVGRLSADQTVLIQGTKDLYLGKVMARDGGNDLALIEPMYPSRIDLEPVRFGAPPEKGDGVVSVCNPTSRLSFPVITAGKVLNPDARVLVNDGTGMLSPPSIVTDQNIIGGCSGGADFNKKAELIGVTRANGSDGAVVIKADHVKDLLNKYAEKRKL